MTAADSRPPKAPGEVHPQPAQRRTPLPEAVPPEPRRPDRVQRTQRLLQSKSYVKAEDDLELLQRDELRHLRLGLEYLKPELMLQARGVHSTVVLFGGTRIVERQRGRELVEKAKQELAEKPDDPQLKKRLSIAERVAAKGHYYDVARQFAQLIGSWQQCCTKQAEWVVTTGGGPGIMEAGNRGANEAGCLSIGLNITLPHEQFPNPYISPELCFQFRYFALRKLHFLLRAKALVAFPGGYGTLDELMDALCLIQTRKIQPMPVILVGQEFWQRVLNIEFLVDEGVIAEEDADLVQYAETAEQILEVISSFYGLPADGPPQPPDGTTSPEPP